MIKITSSLSISTLLGLCLALALPAQAQDRAPTPTAPGPAAVGPAAAGGTEIILYRVPGVRDNGGAENTGVATSFHCTNFSGVTESVRIVVRNFDSFLVVNQAFNINHLQTVTKSTHGTLYTEDLPFLTPGIAINQGTAAIAATTVNIVCTAMTIDASTIVPVGVALRMIRFNPAPGSQE